MTFPTARAGSFIDPDPSQTNDNAVDDNGGGACVGIGIGSKQIWDPSDLRGGYPQPWSTPNDLPNLQRRIGEDGAAVGGPSIEGQDVEFQPNEMEFVTADAQIAPNAIVTPGTGLNRTGQTIEAGQSVWAVIP
jgi:hypothetical protein